MLVHTTIIVYITRMSCDTNAKYCSCLYFAANAFSRIMTKIADEAFSVTGLSSSYAFLLMTINSKPGIQAHEISDMMMLTPSTITRFIEKMENKGYVVRKVSGKYTEVYPTDKSKEMGIRIKEAWKDLHQQYTHILGEDVSKKLTDDIHQAIIKLK